MTQLQPTDGDRPEGLHGIDFGDGFLAVFCERENLLAMYPHVCPYGTGTLSDALATAHRVMATDSRDWGATRVDAFLWAVLVGWECEENHDHEYESCTPGALVDMAERHGWSAAEVSRIKDLRRVIREAS